MKSALDGWARGISQPVAALFGRKRQNCTHGRGEGPKTKDKIVHKGVGKVQRQKTKLQTLAGPKTKGKRQNCRHEHVQRHIKQLARVGISAGG